ncbi:MAG: DEAD/DEAH box helicase family protein [archaeon]
MSFKDLKLKKWYDSDEDDIVVDFYVPTLSNSIIYSRLTGFFSSSSLAVAAKGIAELINNNGKMRLITGIVFSKKDIDAIKEAIEEPDTVIERLMVKEIENISDDFVRDHVEAMAWMIANNKLEIKVAIALGENNIPLTTSEVEKTGIFHQKVGILEDREGNKLSFSGSDNESASGWTGNIEEFKVFRSWIKEEMHYLEGDLTKFEKYWKGNGRRTLVFDMPQAFREKMIQIAPIDRDAINLDKWIIKKHQTSFKLRKYQEDAIQNWVNNSNQGIFAMATGTGKTFTALNALKKTLEKENKIVTIISAPLIHIGQQWIREIKKMHFDSDVIVANSSRTNWKNQLVDNLLDVENGISDNLFVVTTHNTLASSDFIKIITDSKNRFKTLKHFLIVDEVHGIGSKERQSGLLSLYDYRLGLSATPKRWFDFEGTEIILEYFNQVIFDYPIHKAIESGYLTPYEYKPYFCSLTNEELENYKAETQKIAKAYYSSRENSEQNEIFTLICIKRQKIIRNAKNKFTLFHEILSDIGKIHHCLIYCSPQQIRNVQAILNKKGIIQHKFTEKERTRPEEMFDGLSERDFILEKFSEGIYNALVSMKCLDEGVDIPPAQIAIMLDNSGNPKEYIQRRGRILRRYSGKNKATIYDIIVEPNLNSNTPKEMQLLERKIIAKELQRYKDFASSAQNSIECLEKIKRIEFKYDL